MSALKDTLIGSYFKWLKKNVTAKELDNGIIEMSTPLLDRHNDHLQFYVVPQPHNDTLRLTDDGYIINDLLLSGCDVTSTHKRREILTGILNGYGVRKSEEDELFVEATLQNFPQKKHMLTQAMLAVNDMFMTSKANVQNLFWEDVENFLLDHDIRYTENVTFSGKSGFTQSFDFVIPRSKKHGERIIQTINTPTKTRVENLLFTWEDVKETRKEGSSLYAFINDYKGVSTEIISGFSKYEVIPVLWSKKESILEELIA